MNELAGQSANAMLLAETDGGGVRAMVEVVLLVSEPKYQAEPGGFAKTRSLQDYRFATGVRGLRDMARYMNELAEQAEQLEGRVTLKATT